MLREIFLLSLFISLLVSCGDNDIDDPGQYNHPYGYIEGIYGDGSPYDRKLTMVYNGDTLKNKSVEFVSRGIAKPQAVLTFENVITGEAKTVLTVDVIETESPEEGMIHLDFEGIYHGKVRDINYSGFIEPNHILIKLQE
ncbi:MAG: hypothetical protein LBR84_04310 [Tannerella sp.]|jgi:hypothetical protein|nr:hypothetical protein [Tannerella sp.]